MLNPIEIQLPFSGFYESFHDAITTEAVRDEFAHELFGIHYDYLSDEDQDRVSDCVWKFHCWDGVREAYVDELAPLIMDALDLSIGDTAVDYEKPAIASPKYYNFETDRLFVTVDRQQLRRALRNHRGFHHAGGWRGFDKWLNERMRGRDGFIPHYPNALSEWPRHIEWDHNHWGLVLAYLWEVEDPEHHYPVFVEGFHWHNHENCKIINDEIAAIAAAFKEENEE